MKLLDNRRIMRAAAGLLLSLAFTFSAQAKPLIFASDPWPPLVNGDLEQKPTGGFAVELLKEISKRSGIEIEFSPLMPWQRVVSNLTSGAVDLTGPSLHREDRDSFSEITQVLYHSRGLLFYRADRNPPFEWDGTAASLKSYTAAFVTGYSGGELLDNAIKDGTLRTVTSTDDATSLRLVLGKRVDISAQNEIIGWHLVNSTPEFKGQFKAHPTPVSSVDYHFLLSRKSGAYLMKPKFDAAIDSIIEDGSMAKILHLS